nr:lysozyme inhibitor LprI family protein [uncultured Mucilaginibacter sp.]
MKKLLLILCFCLGGGYNAYSQRKIDCANATTQTELTLCAQEEFSATDKQLNALYKKIIAVCNAKERAALIKTQKAWLLYRDEHSEMMRSINQSGSIAEMTACNAKTLTTQSRIKELQALLYQLSL